MRNMTYFAYYHDDFECIQPSRCDGMASGPYNVYVRCMGSVVADSFDMSVDEVVVVLLVVMPLVCTNVDMVVSLLIVLLRESARSVCSLTLTSLPKWMDSRISKNSVVRSIDVVAVVRVTVVFVVPSSLRDSSMDSYASTSIVDVTTSVMFVVTTVTGPSSNGDTSALVSDTPLELYSFDSQSLVVRRPVESVDCVWKWVESIVVDQSDSTVVTVSLSSSNVVDDDKRYSSHTFEDRCTEDPNGGIRLVRFLGAIASLAAGLNIFHQ